MSEQNGVHEIRNDKAEKAALGSILRDPTVFDDVRSILSPTDFFLDSSRQIFTELLKLDNQKKPIDLVVLGSSLHESNKIGDIGGYDYLRVLLDETPIAAHAVYYANIVKGVSLQRQLALVGERIAKEAKNPIDPGGLQDWAETLVTSVRDNIRSETKPLGFYLNETLGQLDQFHEDKQVSLKTGMFKFDSLVSLSPGRFIVIAARPGVGKSLLGNQIPLMLAKDNHPTCIYSLEMSGEEIAARYISSFGKIEIDYVQRRRKAWDAEASEANAAVSQMKGYPIFINQTPWQTIHAITADARKMKRKHNIRLIVIDYLQLVSGQGKVSQQRYEQLGEISRYSKNIARELDVPVIVAAQLNRDSEKDKGGEPRMAQIRESGNIEQDADTVILLWPDDKDEEIVHCKIDKNRNGPKGRLDFRHIKHHMRFEEV